jgi:hypothetical protein
VIKDDPITLLEFAGETKSSMHLGRRIASQAKLFWKKVNKSKASKTSYQKNII